MSLAGLPVRRGVPAVGAAAMAEIDRVAIEEIGVPEAALMESAGRAVARVARLMGAQRVVALAGTGNNGGDALAAARILAGWGVAVSAVAVDPSRLRPSARAQYDACARAGVPMDGTAAGADLVLDGLLGYSARGAPRPPLDEAVRRANASGVPVLAIDLPSGLDPDSGAPSGVAIRASVTVTLGLPKTGLLRDAARPLVGELVLADIGIPPRAVRGIAFDAGAVFGDGDLVRLAR